MTSSRPGGRSGRPSDSELLQPHLLLPPPLQSQHVGSQATPRASSRSLLGLCALPAGARQRALGKDSPPALRDSPPALRVQHRWGERPGPWRGPHPASWPAHCGSRSRLLLIGRAAAARVRDLTPSCSRLTGSTKPRACRGRVSVQFRAWRTACVQALVFFQPKCQQMQFLVCFRLFPVFFFFSFFFRCSFWIRFDSDSVNKESWGLVPGGAMQARVHPGALWELEPNEMPAQEGFREVPPNHTAHTSRQKGVHSPPASVREAFRAKSGASFCGDTVSLLSAGA